MKKSKMPAPEIPSTDLDITDSDTFTQKFVGEIMAATAEGLGLFLRLDLFRLPEMQEFGFMALKQVSEALPKLLCSLLSATLHQASGFRPPPVWRGPKKEKGDIAKTARRKGVQNELAIYKQLLESMSQGGVIDNLAVHASLHKALKPMIGGELSKEERLSVFWKCGQDALIELLVNEKQWMERLGDIVFRVVFGDTVFFERLGRALYNSPKPSLSYAEQMLLVNWDELRGEWAGPIPGLKFWRDDAVRQFLSQKFNDDENLILKSNSYRSIRDRLGLKPEKRKTVKACRVHRDPKTGKARLDVKRTR